MKKKITFLITAAVMLLTMMASTATAWGQTTAGTTLWADDFSYWNADDVPNVTVYNTTTGVTVYGSGGVTYSVTDGGSTTKIYAANLAGGTSPELLISKGGGTFTIANIPTGDAAQLALTYKTNNNNNAVTTTTSGVTVTESNSKASTKTYTITTGGASTITLVVTNSSSSNTRVDDFNLVVAGGDPISTTYTVTFDAGAGSFVGSTDFPNTSNTVEAGTYALPSATPVTGYDFDGWLATGSSTPVTGNYNVTSNIAFTASYSVSGGGSATTVTYDFSSTDNFLTSYPGSTHPGTGNSNNLTTFYYTNGDVFTASGTNRYFNSGYFMLGKSGATLQLPAFDFDVEKIEITGRSAASGSVEQNIYVGNTAVSTATTGAQGTNVYVIADGYETAGTVYTLKVTSAYNTQITQIKVYEKEESSVATPTFNPASGTEFGNEGLDVTISQADSKTIYYTLDGTDPSNASTSYTGAIHITTTTTIKAIAYDGTNASNIATATYTYVDPDAPGTLNNPYTVAQALENTPASGTTDWIYVHGIVSAIVEPFNSQYGNISYNISDDGENTTVLYAYRGKSFNGEKFTSENDVLVGDVVTICGKLKTYQGTKELDANNYLIEQTHPAVEVEAPTFSPAAGTYTEAQSVTLSCETAGASIYYTTNGDDPDTNSTLYNGTAITITSATTLKAIAYSGGANSTVATAVYHICSADNPYSVEQALAAPTPGSNIYVQGIISQIDEVSTSYGNATYYISDDGTTTEQIKVYHGKYLDNAAFTAEDQIQVGDIVKITGDLTVYNNENQLASGNHIVTLTRPVTPSITITPATINEVPCYGGGGQLTVTYANMGDNPNPSIILCDSEGEATTYDWISAQFDGIYTIIGTVSANNGQERTAYLKVCCTVNSEPVCSNIVSITQLAYPTITVATLPFQFDGNNEELANTPGLAQAGLGSSYGDSPKLKFKETGSFVILHFNEAPNTLTFDIKGDGFDGTFKVQTSADNVTYTDLKEYTSSNLTDNLVSESFNTLNANVRYIKWVYTAATSGKVRLGNIGLTNFEPSITFNPAEINLSAEQHLIEEIPFTYANFEVVNYQDFSIQFCDATGNQAEKPDWISVAGITGTNSEGYRATFSMILENTGEARSAYFKVYATVNSETVYSNLVTINQEAGTTPPVGDKYVKVTSSSDLTDGQYLIVYEDGNVAFDGSLTTLDAANNTIAVTISNNEIEITATTAASEFTIAAITGGYSIQSASGYYIGQTSDANGMKTSETEVYTNTISIDTDGNANVIASGGAYMRYNATSGQERFRYFKSSTYTNQNAIQLYKKATGPATPSITANDVVIAYNVTAGVIEYTINNPVEGGSMSAQVTTGGDWPLAISSISATSVNFTIPENESAQERTGVIRLTYTYGRATETKDVNVTQAANPALLPSITVDPDLVEATAAETDGSLGLTYENIEITQADDFGIQYYDEYENELNGDDEPDWLLVAVEGTDPGFYEVTYTIDENDGDARTAYFKVFAMGDSDWVYSNLVTVTQEAASATALYSYSVNGVEGETLEATVGETITLATGDNLNDDFTFAGWTTNPNNVNERLTGTYTLTEDVTVFYAVYAHTTGNAKNTKEGASYVKVTSTADITDGNYLIVYEGEESAYAFDGGLETFDATNNTISVTIDNDAIASTTETDAATFTIASMVGGYSIQGTSGGYIGVSNYNNGLTTYENAVANGIDFEDDNVLITVTVTGGTMTLKYNKASNQKRFRYYKSGQEAIQLYKYTNGGGGTTDYYTRVFLEDPAGNVTIAGPSIIPDGTNLTASITNDLGAGSLIIEDGAQLIHTNNLNATLQKNISGYGDDPTVANGWYLISSPVANLSTSAVTIGTYDLFAYEEAAAYWWSNTGSHSFDALQQGIGYLYANSANQTLNFAGTMVGTNTAVEKAMTAECTYDNLKGYNLMGNPFTCNLENGDIKIGATAITSVLVAEGGDDYVTVNLNDDGAVKPGQGFMVQTAAPATLTLNPGSSKGANSGFVRIVAGNENATDKAYINVANGNTLRKISLSDNTTQVYVMNDDKDYAAARVEELAGTMPVHFKAAEDGEYTITIEAVNADVEYMHLIDNFTGNDIDLLLESSYTFNATTNDSEARFRLDFGTYGVNEIAENNTFAYQYGNEIVVNGEGELQIFDLMGRMIMNTKINGVQSVNVPSNSVYILKLNNNIQKIVVK